MTFHSDEPPPPPVLPEDDSLPAAQRVRNKCINEIVATEYLYARDLERIQEVFMTPIREQKLLDSSQMNAVFGGLSILLGMSRQMAKDLEVQVKKNGCVGSCFQGIAPYLKIYSQYCTNQQPALETLAKLSQGNRCVHSVIMGLGLCWRDEVASVHTANLCVLSLCDSRKKVFAHTAHPADQPPEGVPGGEAVLEAVRRATPRLVPQQAHAAPV